VQSFQVSFPYKFLMFKCDSVFLCKTCKKYLLSIAFQVQDALTTPYTTFFTCTITSQLANYRKKHQILHDNQEGFRQGKCTSRQLQTIIAVLKDSKLTK
jgi:hypothetical protein